MRIFMAFELDTVEKLGSVLTSSNGSYRLFSFKIWHFLMIMTAPLCCYSLPNFKAIANAMTLWDLPAIWVIESLTGRFKCIFPEMLFF